MIALLLCLVPLFTPGLGSTFHLFNSSLALPNPPSNPICPSGPGPYFEPDPHDCTKYYVCVEGIPYLMECPHELYFDPILGICTWPEEAHCTAKCSAQVVLADEKERKLTTWSPEQHCSVEKFQGFPTANDALIPETIHQCSNGLTVVKSQGDGITKLSAYNPYSEQWEDIVMPREVSCVSNYAVATDPNPLFPHLFMVGGKIEFLNDGIVQHKTLNQICEFNCETYLNEGNKDGSAWYCYEGDIHLLTPAYDSCATASMEFLTVVNGKQSQDVPVNDVSFYPFHKWDPRNKSDSVHFIDGVKDCISPKISEVYAIGTEKMYVMNPETGAVKPEKGTLPVIATSKYPVRLMYIPEIEDVCVIGGTEDGTIPACSYYCYVGNKLTKESDFHFPCWAGRVLGTL